MRLSIASASRSRAGTSASVAAGCGLRQPADGVVGLRLRPAEADQGAGQGVGPAGGGPGRGRRRAGQADLVLELEDHPLRALAADAGHQAQGDQVLGLQRPADGVGLVDGQDRLGQPRADPRAGLQQLEQVALVAVGEAVEGEAVLADHQRGGQLGLVPHAQPGPGPARRLQGEPDPADPYDDPARQQRGDHAGHAGDHRRAARGGQPGERRPAPDLADRQRERVRGVGRPRRAVQPQQPGDHQPHLRLVGASGTGHRGLHLRGRVQLHRQAPAGGADDRHGAGLGGAHHGTDVGLREDPLDRDGVRPVLVEPGLEGHLQGDQAGAERGVGRGAHHPDVHEGDPARGAVHDAQAAPGQPGVDSQHPHRLGPPPRRSAARTAVRDTSRVAGRPPRRAGTGSGRGPSGTSRA